MDLTVAEVQARVAKMRPDATPTPDHEALHYEEDEIRREVLEAIASGAEDPAGLAKAALATADIEFCRWYSSADQRR